MSSFVASQKKVKFWEIFIINFKKDSFWYFYIQLMDKQHLNIVCHRNNEPYIAAYVFMTIVKNWVSLKTRNNFIFFSYLLCYSKKKRSDINLWFVKTGEKYRRKKYFFKSQLLAQIRVNKNFNIEYGIETFCLYFGAGKLAVMILRWLNETFLLDDEI